MAQDLPRAVVFDLDGTLADTAPDLHVCANQMLDEMGLPPLGLAQVTSFIGEPGYGFVADLRPDPDPAIEISLFGDGLPFDVPTPSTLGLFAAAIGTVASGLRARKRR